MKKAYKYGIELETVVDRDNFEALEHEVIEKNLPYISKSDGSIHSTGNQIGREWISNGPLTYTALERSIKSFTKILNSNEVNINTSTGFHVHISNKRFFNARNLQRIIFLWCAIEDVLISTQPRSRYNNNYCNRLLRKFVTQSNDNLPKAKGRLIDELSMQDRYYTLNLKAMYDHGTIECRLHSGTIDSTKILAWVDLMVSIYDYALTSYKHEDVLALFNSTISDEKVQKVFELLKLSDDLKSHFSKRVKKFGFDLLKAQQEGAIKALELKPKVAKLAKAYNKTERAFRSVQDEMRQSTRYFEQGL